mmetsp:Transcript_86504/g.173083  ORF Transcript_86504/g.173083 Transcript_86504/m.173083 type:complete len:249 (-) Transcript_86504:209-955(-)
MATDPTSAALMESVCRGVNPCLLAFLMLLLRLRAADGKESPSSLDANNFPSIVAPASPPLPNPPPRPGRPPALPPMPAGLTLAMSNKLKVPLDKPTASREVSRWSSAHRTRRPTPLFSPCRPSSSSSSLPSSSPSPPPPAPPPWRFFFLFLCAFVYSVSAATPLVAPDEGVGWFQRKCLARRTHFPRAACSTAAPPKPPLSLLPPPKGSPAAAPPPLPKWSSTKPTPAPALTAALVAACLRSGFHSHT